MNKYIIEAWNVQRYLAGGSQNIHKIILKIKATTGTLALQKANQLATRTAYVIIGIEEL